MLVFRGVIRIPQHLRHQWVTTLFLLIWFFFSPKNAFFAQKVVFIFGQPFGQVRAARTRVGTLLWTATWPDKKRAASKNGQTPKGCLEPNWMPWAGLPFKRFATINLETVLWTYEFPTTLDGLEKTTPLKPWPWFFFVFWSIKKSHDAS